MRKSEGFLKKKQMHIYVWYECMDFKKKKKNQFKN